MFPCSLDLDGSNVKEPVIKCPDECKIGNSPEGYVLLGLGQYPLMYAYAVLIDSVFQVLIPEIQNL